VPLRFGLATSHLHFFPLPPVFKPRRVMVFFFSFSRSLFFPPLSCLEIGPIYSYLVSAGKYTSLVSRFLFLVLLWPAVLFSARLLIILIPTDPPPPTPHRPLFSSPPSCRLRSLCRNSALTCCSPSLLFARPLGGDPHHQLFSFFFQLDPVTALLSMSGKDLVPSSPNLSFYFAAPCTFC